MRAARRIITRARRRADEDDVTICFLAVTKDEFVARKPDHASGAVAQHHRADVKVRHESANRKLVGLCGASYLTATFVTGHRYLEDEERQ
jgi:hypothetical protein